jgi:putative spermidine/putrescine transport system permease protein
MKARGDQLAIMLFVFIVGCTLVFLILPVLVAILMSFDARSYLGPFPPTGFSSRWYSSFFNSTEYLRGLKTSLVVAMVATATATIVGGAAAVCLDRYRFRGRDFLTAMFLSPLVVPGVVLGFGLLMFSSLCGVYDGLSRLIAGHVIVVLPYTIRTTLASLSGIRPSLAEAARSLGAHGGAVFREITFPLAKTGIVAGAVFAFALSMDEVSASLFLSDPSSYTLPVAIVSQMRSRFDLTIAAVSALLVFFTIVVIAVLDRLVGLDRLIGVGIYRA